MDTKTKKVDKYLTDLKELPVETKEKPKSDFKPKVEEVKSESVKKTLVAKPQEDIKPAPKEKEEKKVEKENKEEVLQDKDVDIPEEVVIQDRPYTSKDIILGVINLLSVAFLVFLLVKLPQKAVEIKALRVDSVKYSDSATTKSVSVSEENVKSSQELTDLFLDDFGIYDFTTEIEKLKATNPAIQKVNFPSQKAVQDKLNLNGVPVVIVMQGDWVAIGQAMKAVESLPFLFRPINVKSQTSKDDSNVIVLNYGGILYVGDKFAKN